MLFIKSLSELNNLIPFLILLLLALLAIVFRRRIADLMLRLVLRFISRRDSQLAGDIHAHLSKPLGWFMAALISRICFNLMNVPSDIAGFGDRVLSTLTTAFAFYLIYELGHVLLLGFARFSWSKEDDPAAAFNKGMDANTTKYLMNFAKVVMIVIAVLSVLGIWIDNLGAIITGLGIGGLLLALAAQDTAANVFASFAIMIDKPFAVGDWIETEGVAGTVVQLGMRSTRVQTVDHALVSIPNSKLGNAVITNGSTRDARQVDVNLFFPHQTPIEQLQELSEAIRSLLAADSDIQPDSWIYLETIGDSSLQLHLRYYTTPDWGGMQQIRERINYGILKLLEERGLEPARPQLVLHNSASTGNARYGKGADKT